jgi:hypothetical protein
MEIDAYKAKNESIGFFQRKGGWQARVLIRIGYFG